MDGENIADGKTVVASNKGKATYSATAMIDEWTDEEEFQDSSSLEEVDPIPEEIILHGTEVTPVLSIVQRAPPAIHTRALAWDTIVQENNLQKLSVAVNSFDKPKVCRAVK